MDLFPPGIEYQADGVGGNKDRGHEEHGTHAVAASLNKLKKLANRSIHCWPYSTSETDGRPSMRWARNSIFSGELDSVTR
jgi:hypothetical protein